MVVELESEFRYVASWFFISWRSLGVSVFSSSVLSLRNADGRIKVWVSVLAHQKRDELTCSSTYGRRVYYSAEIRIKWFGAVSKAAKREHQAEAPMTWGTIRSPENMERFLFNRSILLQINSEFTFAYSRFSSGTPDCAAIRLFISSFSVEFKMSGLVCGGRSIRQRVHLRLIVSSVKGPNTIWAGFHRRRNTVMASGSVTWCDGSSNSCTIICRLDGNIF